MTMLVEEILALAVPVTYFLMYAAESIWPARRFPKQRFWGFIGVGFMLLMMTVGVIAPLLFPVEWLAEHRLLDGTKLGVLGGTIVGILALELVVYGYHIACHRSSFLWRASHQMHHAPQRIDIPGSVIFHPLELLMQNVIVIGTTVFVLGLEPLAAAIIGYMLAFAGMFQHWNVKTPRWIGYVFQRPEAHCHHHELNVHAFNYADLPIWDIVFGTFKNPRAFEGRVGFEEKASFAKMLVGIDVNAALSEEQSGTPKPRAASPRESLDRFAVPGRDFSSTLPSQPGIEQ